MMPANWHGRFLDKWVHCGFFSKKTVSSLPITKLSVLYDSVVSYGENEAMALKATKEIDGSSESCLSSKHAESKHYLCSRSL